jgi:sec-independent protein translocase protein TatC
MVLVFALSFEFPLFVVMLNLANVVSFVRLKRWTRGIIFGIFVFAAVATPSQDPFTMIALAAPMCLLYGVALGVAFLHDRRADRRGDTSPYAHLDDDELSPLDDEAGTRA